MSTDLIYNSLHKVQPGRLTVIFLEVKGIISYLLLEARGLVMLIKLSCDNLSLSSWWNSLSSKIDFNGIITLMSYMATDAKITTSPNVLGLLYLLLSLS